MRFRESENKEEEEKEEKNSPFLPNEEPEQLVSETDRQDTGEMLEKPIIIDLSLSPTLGDSS